MNILHEGYFNDSQTVALMAMTDNYRKIQEARSAGIRLEPEFPDKVLATLFLEPSTRTRLSFESAMHRLGGRVISVSEQSGTSVTKGETIADTIRTASHYADVLVVRAPEKFDTWGSRWECPVINAGDGENRHPSQAYTDLYTIQRSLGAVAHDMIYHKKIGIVGDVGRSRAIHSFLGLCCRNSETFYHDSTGDGGELRSVWHHNKLHSIECKDEFVKLLPKLDVLYLNRVQKERRDGTECDSFTLYPHWLKMMKPNAIVLDPGPRYEELPAELDSDPRIKYWDQIKNGVYVRMAMLKTVLGPKQI